MKRRSTRIFTTGLAIVFFLLHFCQRSYSQQIKQIYIDNSKRTFNEGNPLPAGSYFQVTGGVADEVTLIRLDIFQSAKYDHPVYSNHWRRHFSDDSRTFYIPVDHKLQPNRGYYLRLTYFKTIKDQELEQFRNKIHSNLDAYLDAVTTNDDDRIRLSGSVNDNMNRLNNIMLDSYRYFESHNAQKFEGFSDLIRLKLQQLKKAGLDNARYNVSADSTVTDSDIKLKYATELQDQLLSMLKAEADNYIATGVRTKYDEIHFNDYPTEKTKPFLAVNIGYGAVYLDGPTDDLEYDAQPYVGISIPLANPRFKKFLGNASISFGIFLKDLEDKLGNRLTGPLINKPFYLGLGYKIFDFVKLNAGAVALSSERIDLNNFRTERVTIKPFVGISAEFNIWIGGNR